MRRTCARRLTRDAYGWYDADDGQWRAYRGSLVTLLLAAAVMTAITRRIKAEKPTARLACGLAFVAVAHGGGAGCVVGVCGLFHAASFLPPALAVPAGERPPALVLLYHVEKTGGSSVVRWFEALRNSHHLTHAVGFGHARWELVVLLMIGVRLALEGLAETLLELGVHPWTRDADAALEGLRDMGAILACKESVGGDGGVSAELLGACLLYTSPSPRDRG